MQNFKSYGFVLLTFGFLSSFAFGQNILLTEDFDDSSLPDGWTQQSQASDGGGCWARIPNCKAIGGALHPMVISLLRTTMDAIAIKARIT